MIWVCIVLFFKQKTAYEMRISDWSSYVCSSDLAGSTRRRRLDEGPVRVGRARVPGEGPDVRDLDRLVGIAVDHRSLPVAGHVDLPRDELDRDEGGAAFYPAVQDLGALHLLHPRSYELRIGKECVRS